MKTPSTLAGAALLVGTLSWAQAPATSAELADPSSAPAAPAAGASAVVAAPSASDAPSPKPAFAASDVSSQANGNIKIEPAIDAPIYAEFDGSPTLTERLRQALVAQGFELAASAESAKTQLRLRGDIVLVGGPKFSKGVKVPIGEATEKTLRKAREKGTVSAADLGPADNRQAALSLAVGAAALRHGLTNFAAGLALTDMATALADVSGVRSWFNSAVAGDPRGFCLGGCADWNKVNQTVYLWVTAQQPGQGKNEVRVLSKAFSETVAPEQLLLIAVDQAIERVTTVPGASKP